MAIPMTLFFSIMFFVVFFLGSRLHFPYRDAVAVAFNATGRDFEIAIAIAITAFSPTVALATVVGPLIEVPVMLALVWAAMRLSRRWFGEAAPKVGVGGVGSPDADRGLVPESIAALSDSQ
jgi:ACR3 family arsenite transporter